jgi:hypothetical protein
MTDHRARVERHARGLLAPGEPVIAAVRAATDGADVGVLLFGLGGALAHAAKTRDEAEEMGFPASTNMVVAATDRRLLIFRNTLFDRALVFRGEVRFESLQRVTLRRGLNAQLRFELIPRGVVVFTTYRLDHPDGFVRAVNDAIDAHARLHPVAVDATPGPPLPFPPPPPR